MGIYFLGAGCWPALAGTRACQGPQVIQLQDYNMKKVTDYIFSSPGRFEKLILEQGSDYLVLNDMGDLRKGQIVKFAGFSDVDNHYGIFVFVDSKGKVLEVTGDFSSLEHPHVRKLELAIKRYSP